MKKRHSNIPIFIPELACPHQCVFCNQQHIAGQQDIPAPESVAHTVEQYLETMNDGRDVEIAFFGGSFTGIPIALQEAYLKAAQPYLQSDRVKGIRLSTRPDYIDRERLDMLQAYGVKAIELGAQSTNKLVLQKSGRGHLPEHIEQAAELIKSYDMELGLQMMIGLPEDQLETSIQTARDIIAWKADTTRIYPTIVVKDTALATRYKQGLYRPLGLEEAVNWTKELLPLFEQNGVKVLRVGLHPSEDLVEGKAYVDGPIHPSFKEMVQTAIWKDILGDELSRNTSKQHLISVAPQQLNYAIGFQGSNRKHFDNMGHVMKFKADPKLKAYEIRISAN